jgi:hypothetical protein
LLRDTTAVIDLAHQLGFESHMVDEGTLIVLTGPKAIFN